MGDTFAWGMSMPPMTNAAVSAAFAVSKSAERITGIVYRSSVACNLQLWLVLGRVSGVCRDLASCKTLANCFAISALQSARGVERCISV